MHVDRRGRVWVGSWREGLLLFDKRDAVVHQVPDRRSRAPAQSEIWRITELRDGRLALGTRESGLRIFDPETRR